MAGEENSGGDIAVKVGIIALGILAAKGAERVVEWALSGKDGGKKGGGKKGGGRKRSRKSS